MAFSKLRLSGFGTPRMRIYKTTSTPFCAKITIGTQVGYSEEKISESDLIVFF